MAKKLLKVLGINGQVIIDVIPEIALIIGKQPRVVKLSPREAKNRLQLVFQNFINVFAKSSHPVVIFLDDLQWADTASLKLLELFAINGKGKLFIIGAYRDNEVNLTHPLQLSLNKILKQNIVINHIILKPLDINSINQLICDTLKTNFEKTQELAKLVLEKTRGNPFFVNKFLTSLYEENLIYFNHSQGLEKSHKWQWNIEKIKEQNITDNLVEFLEKRIKKLSQEAQEIIKIASCIGNKFNLEMISLLTQDSLTNIAQKLKLITTEGFIFPLHDLDISLELKNINQDNFIKKALFPDTETLEYQFAHDRIQQAAYSLISQIKKEQIHYQISQLYIKNLSLKQQKENIFEIVNQWNKGKSFIKSISEKKQLAQLNLIASKKAKLSAAYQSSLVYLKKGLNYLSQDSWNLTKSTQKEYELILSLHIETAETAYLCGDFRQMEKSIDIVIKNSSNLLDRIQAYQIKIQSYIAQNQLENAIKLAINTLKKLNLKLPQHPHQIIVILNIIKSYFKINNKNIETLINLPAMNNPYHIAAMEILTSMSSSAYLATPNLAPIIVLKQVNLSLKYGNNNLSAYAYATYGVIISFFLGKIEEGFKFGKLALELLEKYQNDKIKAKTILVFNNLIRHWQEHLSKTIQPLLEGYTIGLQTGDLEFASLCANAYCYHSYFAGKPLKELIKEIDGYKIKVKKFKQNISFSLLNIWYQTIYKLSTKSENNLQIILDHIPTDKTILFVLNFNQLFLYYIFENYTKALEYSQLTAQYLDGGIGVFTIPLFYYYDSLTQLAYCNQLNKTQKKKYLKRVKSNQKKIKKWAKYAPENHLHRFYLIEAQMCQILNKKLQAMEYYDQAIFYAKKNQYIQDEALANEKAGEFYFSQNQPKIAQLYLWEAYYHYLTWGATKKAKIIKEKYPQFIKFSQYKLKQINQTFHINSSTYDSDITLDLETVTKANQAISQSLILEELLINLMNILIENAGADKGYLIIEKKEQLLIEAETSIKSKKVNILNSQPITNSKKVPETIINYVARSKEIVILNHDYHDKKFEQDPYLIEYKPKSLLCIPLLKENKLIAIVYLENNLTSGAFTPNRISMINLLSAQAAISIENSRLYDNLTALNTAYERFIPNQFINLLQKDSITEIELGNNIQKRMSVLFSDIRSFTTLSEKMTPEDNFKFINAYLSRISPAIREYQGFIDKYIGDAIMALFTGKADNAVKAAIKMLHILIKYNTTRQRPERPPIKIGIGINTGYLMLGTVGEKNRMDGTVISDAVNLASRIEGLTKNYGVSLLITHKTFNDLENPNNYLIRLIDKVKVKGKSELITIYEVFDGDIEEIKKQKLITKETFEIALNYYQQNNIYDAIEHFKICISQAPRRSCIKNISSTLSKFNQSKLKYLKF